jgi:sulfofructose kinase
MTGQTSASEAAAALWRSDRAVVVVTCGAVGCWSVTAEHDSQPRHHPAFPVTTTDTTGCGDVFHGAYAAALAAGQEVNERIVFASAAAALRASQGGFPDRSAVEAFLSLHTLNASPP